MQTDLAEFIKDTEQGIEADAILRACVHCGFCTATCPTYQLLGDELDGPRGRIYQIKQVLEGQPATQTTQTHLDRCLTCRSCETTCPSGVKYSHLLDIGRDVVAKQVTRPIKERVIRWSLNRLLTTAGLFEKAILVGRLFRSLLPKAIQQKVPVKQIAPNKRNKSHERKVILTEGCVQPSYKPATNASINRVLDKLGIETITVQQERCCGAVSFHLDAQDQAIELMCQNIDAWWPLVEQGAEAIVSSASGCGVMIKDYGYMLRNDVQYRDKAERISHLTKDISEIIANEELAPLHINTNTVVAFQSPCTLQHGQQLNGKVESILRQVGFKLTEIPDAHLCCGSAGTYSILQKDLSVQLQQNKIRNLEKGKPDVIVTANIGCQIHIETGTNIPVKHWIELLDTPD